MARSRLMRQTWAGVLAVHGEKKGHVMVCRKRNPGQVAKCGAG